MYSGGNRIVLIQIFFFLLFWETKAREEARKCESMSSAVAPVSRIHLLAKKRSTKTTFFFSSLFQRDIKVPSCAIASFCSWPRLCSNKQKQRLERPFTFKRRVHILATLPRSPAASALVVNNCFFSPALWIFEEFISKRTKSYFVCPDLDSDAGETERP